MSSTLIIVRLASGPWWARHSRRFAERALRNISPDHSGLMLAARITLPHFAVSAARCFPKSDGGPANGIEPRSKSRALSLGSARPALISALSLSTIQLGVLLGAPMQYQALAS